jgi:hypothetical protein
MATIHPWSSEPGANGSPRTSARARDPGDPGDSLDRMLSFAARPRKARAGGTRRRCTLRAPRTEGARSLGRPGDKRHNPSPVYDDPRGNSCSRDPAAARGPSPRCDRTHSLRPSAPHAGTRGHGRDRRGPRRSSRAVSSRTCHAGRPRVCGTARTIWRPAPNDDSSGSPVESQRKASRAGPRWCGSSRTRGSRAPSARSPAARRQAHSNPPPDGSFCNRTRRARSRAPGGNRGSLRPLLHRHPCGRARGSPHPSGIRRSRTTRRLGRARSARADCGTQRIHRRGDRDPASPPAFA